MFSIRLPERRPQVAAALAGACLMLATSLAARAAGGPQNFDTTTWAAMKQSLPRPAAVVFATTDCAHCPAAIDGLAAGMRRTRGKGTLAVVIMDGATVPDLRHHPHFAKADRLYVFDGNEMAIRHSVNPDWRGLTPFIALLPHSGEPRFHTGPLSTTERRRFFR
ncbi:MAG: hypothetical protein M0P39_02805 [Rhodocyclaceae bacterium]|jgi:hypothetical protein|nr:hypothetical protein [Rhodocyclaceae bacterium]